MQNTAADKSSWLGAALIGVGLVTLTRVILLAFNKTDLFVDEAQYWLWGQDLAFGYYSKPPMIGWVIRAFTEIGGDAQFWVRLPGPLFHGVTALILGAVAARLCGARAAVLAALAYVTLPMVAVGSLLISTDTIMFPFLAGALLGYLVVLERGGTGAAVLAGGMLGLAFLSKYAAVYYLICAALVAVAVPTHRPSWKATATILIAFLVAASPNLIWNLSNGLTTVQHTLDNADWVRDPSARAGLNWASLGEFFGAQFAVFGPVLFTALLVTLAKWRSLTPHLKMLVLFALPIIAIVCVQALLSRAYANWAAAAYLAGVVAVIWKLPKPWLIASFAINGFLCLLFPIATTAPTVLARDGQPLLNRYLERHELSRYLLEQAETANLEVIVASDRDILADLFYTARDNDILIFAVPPKGRAPHHYAQQFPLPNEARTVLFVTRSDQSMPCADASILDEITPETGAYRSHSQTLYRVPADCFHR